MRTILRKLTDISVHGVEIQLKILQTVLPLLTNYRSVHDDILAEVYDEGESGDGLDQILTWDPIKGSFDLFSVTRFQDRRCQ